MGIATVDKYAQKVLPADEDLSNEMVMRLGEDTPPDVPPPDVPPDVVDRPNQRAPGSQSPYSSETIQDDRQRGPEEPQPTTAEPQSPYSKYVPPKGTLGLDATYLQNQTTNLENKLDKNPLTQPTTNERTGETAGGNLTDRQRLEQALKDSQDRLTAAQTAGQTAPVVDDKGPATTTTTTGGVTQAPPGFEQSKWADPNYTSPKYIGGHILANGGTTQDVVARLGAGWSVVDGQRIRDPQGNVIDVFLSYNAGGRQPQWNVESGPASDASKAAASTPAAAASTVPRSSAMSVGAGAPGAGAGAGGQVTSSDALIRALLDSVSPGAGAGASTGQGTSGQSNGFNDQIRRSILDRLSKVTGEHGVNDPEIRSRLNAYTAASQAAQRRGQSQFAERAYAEGLPAGATEANSQQLAQKGASDQGAYAADLVGEQIDADRKELEQLLALGGSILTQDEQNAIRAQIAALDAQLQREGQGQQNQQFYDTLGSNIGANEATLNGLILQYLHQ